MDCRFRHSLFQSRYASAVEQSHREVRPSEKLWIGPESALVAARQCDCHVLAFPQRLLAFAAATLVRAGEMLAQSFKMISGPIGLPE